MEDIKSKNIAYLTKEFIFLHNAIYKEKFDKIILYRYIQCSLKFLSNENIPTDLIMSNIDIEALEFYLRIKQKDNVVSKKLKVILYLTEANSLYFYHFSYNNSLSRLTCCLIFAPFVSIIKFVKGFLINRKYGII